MTVPIDSELFRLVTPFVHPIALAVAEDDLRQVRNNLYGPEPTPTGAAYHCQQAVEKLVKAVLVSEGVNFPRSHDIDALIALLPTDHPMRPIFEPFARLSIYATAYRYPREDDDPEPGSGEVQDWLEGIMAARRRLIAWLNR